MYILGNFIFDSQTKVKSGLKGIRTGLIVENDKEFDMLLDVHDALDIGDYREVSHFWRCKVNDYVSTWVVYKNDVRLRLGIYNILKPNRYMRIPNEEVSL